MVQQTSTVHKYKSWFKEIPVVIGLITGGIAMSHWSPTGGPITIANMAWTLWILVCIMACAFRAILQADILAVRFGEPLGTIILTVSAIIIEVAAVSAMVFHIKVDNPVARDTMFAVLMLILNLLMGMAIILGCAKKNNLEFNKESAGNYLSFIVALAAITLILPRFTHSEEGGWMSNQMSIFVGGSALVIYILFLTLQASRGKENFSYATSDSEKNSHTAHQSSHSTAVVIGLLFISLCAVVVLAENIGERITSLFDQLNLPKPLVGIFIATLVLAPEGLAALGSARANDMQRTINVLLGSALATIGLTVPAVIVLEYFTGVSPELGLESPYIVLFVATLTVCMVNLNRGRVNMMMGVVHILLFFTWVAVIFDETSVYVAAK